MIIIFHYNDSQTCCIIHVAFIVEGFLLLYKSLRMILRKVIVKQPSQFKGHFWRSLPLWCLRGFMGSNCEEWTAYSLLALWQSDATWKELVMQIQVNEVFLVP